MFKKNLYSFLLFLIFELSVFSQDPAYANYTVKDGLPSSETYDIFQDSLGFMWFLTDKGIARYDGSDFQTFDQSGLPDVIFDFFKESETKVWISTMNNQLFFFNPCEYPISFHEFKFNTILKKEMNKLARHDYIKGFKIIDNDYYFTFSISTGYLKITKKGQAESNFTLTQELPYLTDKTIIITPDLIYTTLSKSKNPLKDQTKVYDKTSQNKYIIKESIETLQFFAKGITKILNLKKKLIILSQNDLLKLDNGEINSKYIVNRGLDIVFSPHKNAYILTTHNGAFLLSEDFVFIDHFFKDIAISSVFIDQQQNLWFGTIERGVFLIKNLNVRSQNVSDQFSIITNVFFRQQKKIFTNGKKSLLVLNEQTKKNTLVKNVSLLGKDNLFRLDTKSDTLTLGSPDFRLKSVSSPKKSYHYHYKTNNQDSINIYLTSTGNRIWYVDENEYFKTKTKLDIIGNRLTKCDSSTYFIAAEQGLYNLILPEKKCIPYHHQSNNLFKKPAKFIEKFGSGYVVGTRKDGIYYFEENVKWHIDQSDGLLNNRITDLLVENDSVIWVSSFSGINRIIIDRQKQGFSIESITRDSDGIPSNEITDLNINNDTIWTCTRNGVCFFDSKTEFKTKKPLFYIDSIQYQNSTYHNPTEDFVIDYDQDLTIYFSGMQYGIQKPANFEYKLSSSKDGAWKLTNSNSLSLAHLPSGEHTVSIKRQDNLEILGVVNISVTPPYWQKWYFIVAISIMLIVLLILLIRVSIKINNKRKQKEIDKVKLEIKALTSQMNPHFTFNTINSIQHYLIQNDKIGGIQYLSEYAKLIRQSLNHSRNEFITIKEELEFLKLYYQLEQKRFDKTFELNFTIDLESPPDKIQIPSLLLQPLIENAIIHGVNAVDYPGEINIIINESSGMFEIEINDNGIGLLNSSENNLKKSHGLNILKDRLKIYNDKNATDNLIDIDYMDTSLKTGTKIQFKLPIKYLD